MGFNIKKFGRKLRKRAKSVLKKVGDDLAEGATLALGAALAPMTGGASMAMANLAKSKIGDKVAKLVKAAKQPGQPALVDAGSVEVGVGANPPAKSGIFAKGPYRFHTFS